jgi:crossover junction endodeoxyribonuclease RusA
VIELLLPYPVSANRYWRHAAGRTYLSQEARDYKALAAIQARTAGIHIPLAGIIAVTYTLHPRKPKDWAKRESAGTWKLDVQRMDLGNAEKVTSDALNGIMWEDDRQIVRILMVLDVPVENGALHVRVERP